MPDGFVNGLFGFVHTKKVLNGTRQTNQTTRATVTRRRTKMLHGVLSDDVQKANDELLFTHSDLICLLDNQSRNVEQQGGIFFAELVISHRKLDVIQRFVKACW